METEVDDRKEKPWNVLGWDGEDHSYIVNISVCDKKNFKCNKHCIHFSMEITTVNCNQILSRKQTTISKLFTKYVNGLISK